MVLCQEHKLNKSHTSDLAVNGSLFPIAVPYVQVEDGVTRPEMTVGRKP